MKHSILISVRTDTPQTAEGKLLKIAFSSRAAELLTSRFGLPSPNDGFVSEVHRIETDDELHYEMVKAFIAGLPGTVSLNSWDAMNMPEEEDLANAWQWDRETGDHEGGCL